MSIIKTHDVTLCGETNAYKIVLRPLCDEHLSLLYKWCADPEVLYWTEGGVFDTNLTYNADTVHDIYGGVSQNAFCFLIELNGVPIGECWLQKMNMPNVKAMYSETLDIRRIDMAIGEKDYWNKGIGTKFIGMLIDFAFKNEKVDVLHCFCENYNIRSQRMWEKHGFIQILKEPLEPQPQKGKWQYHYRLTRQEFLERKLKSILTNYGISNPTSIKQIYRSAWDIDDAYVLKTNDDKNWLDKSVLLNRLLLSEGMPVIEYIDTTNGEPYVCSDEKYWSLMKKIKGCCFDPFIGDLKQNGIMLGKIVAEIHKALKNIEDKIDVYDSDFLNEFSSWIVPELDKNKITFKDGVMDSMYAFFKQDYKALPRQLIHRDIHTSNLLYDNGVFSYLDFDMSQKNVRVFDIVYLGCSQLVDNYKNEARLKQWCEIFKGILQGYNELLPLSENEIDAIPSLFVFDEILFTAFFLKNGQTEIAKSCEEMTNWLYDNIATLI